jgi:hypothetical protein
MIWDRPRHPGPDTFNMDHVEKYGKMTHIIYYADRTITIAGFRSLWASSSCPRSQAAPALRRRHLRFLRGRARSDPQRPNHGRAVLLLLPGHRRLPLGRVRDEQGEAGGLPGAQEEAQREQTGAGGPSKTPKLTRRAPRRPS